MSHASKGADLGVFDRSALQILREAESEFRNVYWRIRNARRTDWKAVNRARLLAEVLRVCGVPAEAVKEARACLRVRVCDRCVDRPIKCYELSRRAGAGDFES
jgi:hypothetical protein